MSAKPLSRRFAGADPPLFGSAALGCRGTTAPPRRRGSPGACAPNCESARLAWDGSARTRAKVVRSATVSIARRSPAGVARSAQKGPPEVSLETEGLHLLFRFLSQIVHRAKLVADIVVNIDYALASPFGNLSSYATATACACCCEWHRTPPCDRQLCLNAYPTSAPRLGSAPKQRLPTARKRVSRPAAIKACFAERLVREDDRALAGDASNCPASRWSLRPMRGAGSTRLRRANARAVLSALLSEKGVGI